jgi:hypothetical protein
MAGAAAALVCTLIAHAVQFLSFMHWDLNGFIRYLGSVGDAWGMGPWYFCLSAALASLTGGIAAVIVDAV